ncbi:MAG: DUF58 domain-containing protein [Opitutales bacterium]
MVPPRQIYQDVRRLELRSRRLVTDALSGAYHSVFKGQGIDFEQVREYTPGDDVRAIDWNVSARMNRPFLKEFREERELTVMLLVDLSASTAYGSVEQAKRERAAEVAAVLTLAASRNQDKAGLMLFTDRVEHLLLPRKGRRYLLRIVRDVLFYEPAGHGTDLVHALDTLNRVQKRQALVFILSDFYDPNYRGKLFEKLSLTARRHDVTALVLSDPLEKALPDVGLVSLRDAETGQLIELNTSSAEVRDAFIEQARRRDADLARRLARAGVGHVPVSTTAPYINDLRQYFERRQRLRRH